MAQMRGLDGLIRMWKWRLDERRRIVVDLEVMRADIDRRIALLETELEKERSVAGSDVSLSYTFAAYRRANRERVDRLRASREEVVDKIAAAQEEVNAAFRELKKYELVKENRLQQEARERARIEQAELDEAGLQGFLRRQEETEGGPPGP